MNLANTIKSVGKNHWGTATWFLGFTIIFGAGPMLINIIINTFLGKADPFFLIDNGQVVVFSAAVVSSGFYFVGKDFKRTVFPGRQGFILILGILWAIVFSIFTVITIYDSMATGTSTINWGTVRLWSLIILVISLIVVYIAAAINEWRTEEHYKPPIYKRGTGGLEEEFDKTAGGAA